LAATKKTHVYLGPVILAPVVKPGDRINPKALPEPLASLAKEHQEFKTLMVRPDLVDQTRIDLQRIGSPTAHDYRTAARIVRSGG
jgi:hypothetical protein